jgi:translation initiation factor IF-3
MQKARELGLDLVEVAPNSRPPVCRIMDYGKFKYELSKKDRAAKKKQQATQLKEMRYRPKIDEHDYQFKTKHVRSFLESGNKVKAFVLFRGREMAHIEFGRTILDRLAEEMADVANLDMEPKMEGNHMTMILAPRSDLVKKTKDAKKKYRDEADNNGSDDNDAEDAEAVTADNTDADDNE